MNLPAVLFDFDGTLMDSEPAVISSYAHVFKIYATPEEFTDERKTEVLGPPLETEMRKFFPNADVYEVMEEYRRFQEQHLRELMKPMKGAVELLTWLKEQGYPTGIVTSRLRKSLELILKEFDLEQYFDVLVCQDDHLKAKPAPDGILYAMEQLGCTESIYAGDSVSDLLAGRNAGSTVIAALTKIEKEQGLIDFGPDHAVYDLDEIRKILQKKYEQ